jgi:hypothetical protein
VFDEEWPERVFHDLAVDPHEQHKLSGQHGYGELEETLEERLIVPPGNLDILV